MPGFFPIWVIVTHFLNISFLLLLALGQLLQQPTLTDFPGSMTSVAACLRRS